MLQFLDHFLTVFHSAFILFILLGWIHPATRKAHIVALALTAAAWGLLGLKYGLGYCPLTDWQWDIKRELGEKGLPNSFTKYIADSVTGLDINSKVVDIVTLAGLIFGVIMAAVTWLKKSRSA